MQTTFGTNAQAGGKLCVWIPQDKGIKLKVALLMCRANSQTARGQKKSPLSTVQDATR